VTLKRVAFTCRRCRQHAHALDDRLGLEGFVSPRAQRLLCVVGAEWSFARCARYLRDLAGLVVCDNTIRKVCDRHGGLMRVWQREDPEASRQFREASGDVEFQTDGTCVNTTTGWREVRLSIFAKRDRGEPVADLAGWDGARLPAPGARVATAAVRTSDALGPQWRRTAARLGVKCTAELTVLADGAKWIWNEAEKNLPGAAGVLDFYHAGEHLHAAAVALARGGGGGRGVVRRTPRDPAAGRGGRGAGGVGGRSRGRVGPGRLPDPARGPHAIPAAADRGAVDRQRDGRGGV
jgi:hypothetical protein